MNAMAIEEFVVRVGPDRRVEAQWQRAGSSQSVTGVLDIDDLRQRTINAFVDLLRSNRLRKVEELRLLGEHLFVTLFGSSGPPEDNQRQNRPGVLFRQAIQGDGDQDGAGGRLLRIVLEVGAGAEWLASWPWEYLYVPRHPDFSDGDLFLGESRKFMLTRRLPLAVTPRTIQVRPPLRVLFVVLSPSNLDPIEYESVLETLVRLRDAADEERIDLQVLSQEHGPDGTPHPPDEDLEVQATWASFLNSVEQFDPHIVHLISHGRYSTDQDGGARGEVAFPTVDTTAEWRADRDLANQLNQSGSSLRLVFLQSCESAAGSSNAYHVISGMAQSLAQKNIPAVVAMHFRIKSVLANTFARAFYENLVARNPIEVAMHAARRQLYLGGVADEAHRSDFGTPVLYLRESSPLLTPPVPQKAPPARGRSARVAVPGGPEDRADAAQLLARLDQPERAATETAKSAWRRSTGERTVT